MKKFTITRLTSILELAFNFIPGQINPKPALDGLLLTYSVGTALGLFLAVIPLIRYPLNKEAHQLIRSQLDLRQQSITPS